MWTYCTTLMAALSSSLAPSAPAAAWAPPATLPEVLINEVCFDPIGIDAQATIGCEWIELYAVNAVQLSTFQLVDNLGQSIGTLPSASVPAGTYVLLVVGGNNASVPFAVDRNFTDHTA